MKTYSQAPDVTNVIERVQQECHEELKGVTVAGLFAFHSESSLPVLKHGGYPAGAIVRITPLKERVMGVADSTIVVDRAGWLTMSQPQRDALIDHELTHLERKVNKKTGRPTYDAFSRPKLVMRRHDHQFGWFDEVAQRHGEASPEMRQARALMEASGQLYFDFRVTVGTKTPSGATNGADSETQEGDGETMQAADDPKEIESSIHRQINQFQARKRRRAREDAAGKSSDRDGSKPWPIN